MDFALSEEQVAIRDMARDFGRELIAPHALEWEAAGAIPRAVLREAAGLGFAAMVVPEAMGGAGLTRLDAARVIEALAMACPPMSRPRFNRDTTLVSPIESTSNTAVASG